MSELSKISDKKLKCLLEECTLLTDPLGRTLIKKMSSPHSPISINEFPIEGFTRTEALVRMYKFEEIGVCTSKMEKNRKNGTDYYRVFYPTGLAEKIAKIYK